MLIEPDATFTVADFGLIFGFAGTVIGATLFVIGYATSMKRDIEKKVEANKKDIDDFKLHVAQNYAPAAMIEKVEAKLTDEIRRLGDRLDHLFQKPRRNPRADE